MKKLLTLVFVLSLCIVTKAQPFASGYVVNQQKPMEMFAGQQFVDITMKGLDGKDHKMSEYVGKGNYVLVDFWASWCQPCMMEMPNVKACYDKYHKKGFDVVGYSLDERDKEWRRAITENNLNWHHLCDLKGFESLAASTYKLEFIPWCLLCDGKGKIIAVGLRGEALGAKLKEIYGF